MAEIIQRSLLGEDLVIQDPEAIARQYLQSTRGIGQPTITSLSGGRTSAWMAINYPTDYYVFALVRTNDPGHTPKDPGLVAAVRAKCPDFVGSLELPDTLRCVLELEQKLGKEIKWVWGENYEDVVERKGNYLPNRFTRYCTTELKYIPIFDWVSARWPNEVVEMNLGFRVDEPDRVCRMVGGVYVKGKGWDFSDMGRCEDHPRSRRKVEWRFRQAPLFLDGVKKHHVHTDPWIKSQPFPDISNCTHCPFHTPKEHRIQHQQHPKCAAFWTGLEEVTGNTFVNGVKLQEILEGTVSPLLDAAPCGCTD